MERNPHQLMGVASVMPATLWADFPPIGVGPGEAWILIRKRGEDAAAQYQIHNTIYRQCLQKQAFESTKSRNQARYGTSSRAASAGPARSEAPAARLTTRFSYPLHEAASAMAGAQLGFVAAGAARGSQPWPDSRQRGEKASV